MRKVLISAVVFFAMAARAFAADFGQDCLRGSAGTECRSLRGGEGTVPFPFGEANRYVELANGEKYVLEGIIRERFGQYYFEVNLEVHTWLGGAARKSFPFYLIYRDESEKYCKEYYDFSSYVGQRVRIFAEAQAASSASGVQVKLKSLLTPQRLKSVRCGRWDLSCKREHG